MTTRPPRPGEVDGVNYHFVSHETFDRLAEQGGLLEFTRYCGNGYGTPCKQAEEVLASGRNLILEIEVDGAMQVKAKFPEAVSIMLLPPSYKVQEAGCAAAEPKPRRKFRPGWPKPGARSPCSASTTTSSAMRKAAPRRLRLICSPLCGLSN